MGRIITFYSYKGGVGRTMALANVAVLLAKWEYNVLVVDWDLEAPGIEFFFKDFLELKTVAQREGVIDILNSAFEAKSEPVKLKNWADSLIRVNLPEAQGTLHLLTAGKKSEDYFRRVRSLDLKKFYDKKGGFLIENLRNEWKEKYDYILIDSRTGITDIGGICTIQLPDILVLHFTATEQSLNGIIEVSRRANRARQELPVDRPSLLSVPIPSRFDTGKEFKISQEWLDRFALELAELYANWLPESIKKRDFLATTKIPYVPYFSFGEKLPVLEEGTIDPAGLGYAFENLAALLGNNLEKVELLLENRDEFIRHALKWKATSRERQTETATEREISTQIKSGPRIFLSYARGDESQVISLYKKLSAAGYKPWMDRMDILPGERWQASIEKAIQRTDFLLVCLSKNSVSKRSFIQKEIKTALDIFQNKLFGEAWLIPIRLDDSEVPKDLHNLQWLNLFEKDGWTQLLQVLQVAMERREVGHALIFTSLPVEYNAVRTHLTNLREETLPEGTVYELGRFSSTRRPWEVGIFEIGASNTKSALDVARAIQLLNPSIVLLVGIAGGIKEVTIGDVVVTTKVYGYEYNRAEAIFQPGPDLFTSTYSLEQRARAEARKNDWLQRIKDAVPTPAPRVFVGAVAASEKLVRDTRSSAFKFLRSNYGDVLAAEIEGRGFLEAARTSPHVEALIIRGISDLIEQEKQTEASNNKKIAARHASAFAFEVLDKWGKGDENSHRPNGVAANHTSK